MQFWVKTLLGGTIISLIQFLTSGLLKQKENNFSHVPI